MASSESTGEVNQVVRAKKEDFIDGITDGLEDFIEGRHKHFKKDDELEAYMMSLWALHFANLWLLSLSLPAILVKIFMN